MSSVNACGAKNNEKAGTGMDGREYFQLKKGW